MPSPAVLPLGCSVFTGMTPAGLIAEFWVLLRRGEDGDTPLRCGPRRWLQLVSWMGRPHRQGSLLLASGGHTRVQVVLIPGGLPSARLLGQAWGGGRLRRQNPGLPEEGGLPAFTPQSHLQRSEEERKASGPAGAVRLLPLAALAQQEPQRSPAGSGPAWPSSPPTSWKGQPATAPGHLLSPFLASREGSGESSERIGQEGSWRGRQQGWG